MKSINFNAQSPTTEHPYERTRGKLEYYKSIHSKASFFHIDIITDLS